MSYERNLLEGYPEFMLPRRVVDVRRGIGSFLLIDLDGSNDVAGSRDTRWTIWVYLCDWVLIEGDKVILDSDCSDKRPCEECLRKIVDVELLRAVALESGESCQFTFSNNLQLMLEDASDAYGAHQEMIKIFRNDSFFLAFKSGSGLVRE